MLRPTRSVRRVSAGQATAEGEGEASAETEPRKAKAEQARQNEFPAGTRRTTQVEARPTLPYVTLARPGSLIMAVAAQVEMRRLGLFDEVDAVPRSRSSRHASVGPDYLPLVISVQP